MFAPPGGVEIAGRFQRGPEGVDSGNGPQRAGVQNAFGRRDVGVETALHELAASPYPVRPHPGEDDDRNQDDGQLEPE